MGEVESNVRGSENLTRRMGSQYFGGIFCLNKFSCGYPGVILGNSEGLVQAGQKQSFQDGEWGRAAADGGRDAETVPARSALPSSCAVHQPTALTMQVISLKGKAPKVRQN